MCGIICYNGYQKALPILLNGLKKLEYRGYDSAGLSIVENRETVSVKAEGKVSNLEAKTAKINTKGTIGIAHTRWATHGKPSEINAHPQFDEKRKVSIVHNGIIENYMDLKEEMQTHGHNFISDTDTEVIAHLIDHYFSGDLEIAVLKTVERLSGTFGLAVMHADIDNKIIVVKRGSPIVVGIGDNEYFAASDPIAISDYTNKIVVLNDDEMAILNQKGYYIKNLKNEVLKKNIEIVDKDAYSNDKKGFESYMLKEIFEQPISIRNAYRGRLIESEGVSKLGGLEPVIERLKNIKKLIIVSCGTSYYSGKLGRYIFESLTELDVEVELASEFRYRKFKLDKNVAVLALSQSGETADTIAALKEAKRKGALLLGIVNEVGTTIPQMTEAGVYNHAGPEIGVASTKIYTSQLVLLVLTGLLIGRYHGLSFIEGKEIIDSIKRLPEQIKEILSGAKSIQKIAQKYADYRDFLYIGRLFNYPTAMEAALKLKEISYIHAEGYPAGEMKHGPISLIDENFPTVAIAPDDEVMDKMLSNIEQIKARNGKIISVTNETAKKVIEISDDTFIVPKTLPVLQPVLNIIPLQLFAYYIAKEKGRNIDKPRNLAKSVTVE